MKLPIDKVLIYAALVGVGYALGLIAVTRDEKGSRTPR